MTEYSFDNAPTFGTMFKYWWAFTWRTFLWLLAVYAVIFVASFIVGFFVALMGVQSPAFLIVMNIVGGLAGIAGGIWAFTKAFSGVLNKPIAGRRLVLLHDMVDKDHAENSSAV